MMNKRMVSSLFAVFCATVLPAAAQTTVPSGMTYQGRLTDSNGNPSPDGTGYEIEVRLWTTSSGGTTPIWAARYAGVPVKRGGFNIILGAPGGVAIGGAIADLKTVFATAPTTYLGLTVTKNATGGAVSGPTEILPRQQLFSSPYAFRAEVAASVDPNAIVSASIKDGEVKSADLGDASVTNSKIAADTVDGAKIASRSITSTHIMPETITPDRMVQDYAVFVDEKAVGTSAGNAIAGWQTRVLNKTTASAGSSITRNGNIVTLQPGTYFVDGSVPAYAIHSHEAILRNLGDDTTAVRGTCENTDTAGNNSDSRSVIRGYMTVTGTAQSFDVYLYTKAASTNGLGIATTFATGLRTEPPVFTTIHILRVN